MTSSHTKVAIIGAGPAGLTAAIYAGRALLQPTVFTGLKPGGQLMDTTEIENYPGFIEGILGPELMQRMQDQAKRFDVTFHQENVTKLNTSVYPFELTTATQTMTADSVILAMGSSYSHLGLASEERLAGHGVSYCATCDGFFFRGKNIAVIGGGDSAMEEATFLTRFATKVTIIHRRDELRASGIMQERVRANPKIEFILDTEVRDILGQDTVTGLKLWNKKTNTESELPVEGVFVAIGHVPNSDFLDASIDKNDKGYVIIHEHYQTSVPGVFVAGDIHDHRYRQAITAAGMGCAAALEAERYLHHKKETI